jgi:amino acid adenylation domain-containing protein
VKELLPEGQLDDMFDTYCRLLWCLADEDESWQESRFVRASKLIPSAQLERRMAMNATGSPLSKDLLHSFFFEQALRRPDQTAVITPTRTLRYKDLQNRANQAAHWLRQRGAHPNSLVAVIMEKGWEQVVGVLGVLASGAAYLPIDATLPKERLAYILEHGQVSLALTQSWHDRKIEWPEGIQRFCVDQADQLALNESCLEPVQKPGDLAYVIYTSGSTGLPKGVVIDHCGAVNTILDINQRFQVKPEDRVLALSALNFDLSVYDVFGLLAAGGTIVMPEAFSERDPTHWAELVVKYGVTMWNTVPALMQMLVEYLAGRSERLSDSLRLVMMSGDWIPVDLPDRIKNMAVGVKVVGLGGATEASIWSILYPIEKVELSWKSIPYGRPMANQSFHVLNDALTPCPVWVPGQLYIGGIGLAKGYWRDEEKTQESFITHPRTGERLYRTGDLGRFLPDGNIEFLGREDFQVKIGGYRIELGEIETAIVQHPRVKAAAVMAAGDARRIKRLVAYVVPIRESVSGLKKEKNPPTADGAIADELMEFLRGKLPEYMVPASFVLIDSLPLSDNGKVDRKALSELGLGTASRKDYVAPQTSIESAIVEVWKEVLKLEQVGVHDDFFELGGHSLLATQVMSRINRQFNMQLPLRDLFEGRTAEALAKVIDLSLRINEPGLQKPVIALNQGSEAMVNVSKQTSSSPLRPASRDRDSQLSFSQQRLWFLDQFEPGNVAYNISETVRIRGTLNVTALEQGLSEIVRRHEALRTIFAAVEGQPFQQILPPEPLTLFKVDLRLLPDNEREAETQRLITEEAMHIFNLANSPLFRATLLQRSEEEYSLLLTMHHIISDGWSMEVLSRELWALYDAFSKGHPSPLAELPFQYADYAQWQREWFQGEEMEKQLRYWKERLAGAQPMLELPTDRPRPVVQSFRGAHHTKVLPDSLLEGLQALSQESGVTLFMTLLAAFQLLLHRYTGQEDIVVGSPIAGRNRTEVENLIGLFVNTLVLRSDFKGNPTFRELLGQVREVALGAYEHQDLPFEKLVEELKPERQGSYSPLIQVMFALQNKPMESFQLSQLTISPEILNNNSAQFDLTLLMDDNAKGFNTVLIYNPDLFDQTTIERMMGHFQTLIEGIVSTPELRVSELPLLLESERHQLFVTWNDTRRSYPRGKCIHQLFEDQVARTPKNVSVVCEDHQLTYFELNARANQLAHYLQKHGVGPDVMVGIYAERSLELAVGVLAVLKAGGAYVPLDTSCPRARLSFMIEDAQIPLLLTQKQFMPQIRHNAKIICLDEVDPDIGREIKDNPVSDVAPHHLAYLIYTSGSSGIPKGVMISHQALNNQMHWMLSTFPITEADRMLQSSPLGFDPSISQFFFPLLAGAKLILASPGGHQDCNHFIRLLSEQKVALLDIVPSMLRALLEQEEFGRCTSLKRVLCGGEVLPAELRKLFFDKMDAELYNMYGPTEATITSHFYLCSAADAISGFVPIGRPIANTQTYILDNHLQPVPVGVTGELYIGGEGLARGYLNRPELTAEKFILHSFNNAPRVRLYRTGDLTRFLPDGNIEFIGRIDNQVKLRGFRIELGEIETVLKMHPAVNDAVALMREDQPGNKRIVAYVVLKSVRKPDDQEFRNFIQGKLPGYMVPSAFVVINSLPLTQNGKVERNALSVPDPTLTVAKQSFLAPRDSLELYLAKIFEKLLCTMPVGIRDNFFELGGHSLLAIQVVSQIKKYVGRRIAVADLYSHPTVEQLAESIRSEGWSSPFVLLIPFQPLGSKPPFFCIHGAAAEAANLIGLEQPFYGAMPHGHLRDLIPATIEEMASDYVREIRAIQPEGPYYIGGYSFGGLLAFEMSHQIKSQGQKVALLVLIDATPAEKPMENPSNAFKNGPKMSLSSRIRAYIIRVGKQLAGLRPKEMICYILKGIWARTVKGTAIESKMKEYICRGCIAAGIKVPKNLSTFYRHHIYDNAVKMYAQKKYDGQAVLFRAVKEKGNIQKFWQQQFENGLEIHELQGCHFELFEHSQVGILAKKLKLCLERVQNQARSD